jgi:hypothetical protein
MTQEQQARRPLDQQDTSQPAAKRSSQQQQRAERKTKPSGTVALFHDARRARESLANTSCEFSKF